MKRPAARILACACALFSLVPTTRPADPPLPGRAPDNLLQQELKQQQIRTTTKRVGQQLESVIAEFDRNGIQGEDVKVLQAIRSVLDRLSDHDMEKVVQFLQQTRAETDPTAATRHATEAFAGQKTIIVQLNQLVLEYQRQQALYEISLRLRELASRQSANMWLGVGLERSVRDKAGFHQYLENDRINLRYQQSEQSPLKDETAAILKKLDRLSTGEADGPTADRTRQALAQAKEGGLMPALESAVTELGESALKLASAIGNEKKARDQMREIARLLILSTDPTESLKQAIMELDRAMDVQRKVSADTRKTEKRDEADRRATEQASVADDTDLIRRDVDSLAPIAAEHLKSAVGRMLEARESLERADEPKRRVERALPRQDEALTQMREARHALEEQLARAEELKPENALAALRELQKEVRELIQKEETLKQETAETKDRKPLAEKAPRQGELKDKAQDLQARAAKPSAEAASNLGDAANQMQKAQNSLAQQQNNPAAQQAAIDALQKADEALGQDIKRLEQAEKDLAKVEEMQKKLAGIIEDEQKIQSSTARQAAKKQPDAAAAKELSQQQEKTRQDTGGLKEEASAPAPAAASHLDDAAREMAAAKSELDKPAPRAAQPPEGKALNSLYQAKNELDRKANDLREQLGLPADDNAAALAEAQKAIEQAQQDVNNALGQLQQAPPGLLDALQKQQQEIAKSLSEARQDSPSAPLNQAQQSANDAAQQLSDSNLPKAIDSMKAARKAMAQAQQSGGPNDPPGQPAQPDPNASSPAGIPSYYVGPSSNAVVFIEDNDGGTNTTQQIVNITTVNAQAAELPLVPQNVGGPHGMDSAVFRVTRSGQTNLDLPVKYTVTGSAANGVDYAPLSGQVTIAAGADSTNLEVVVLDDLLIEGTESVIVTLEAPLCTDILSPGPGCYLVGPNRRALASILDNEAPPPTNMPPVLRITSPRPGAHFAARSNITIEAETTDPDGHISTVEFFANDLKIGESVLSSVQPPPAAQSLNLDFQWRDVPPGTYILTTRTRDDGGADARSAPVLIAVDTDHTPPGAVPVVQVFAEDSFASEGTNYFGTNNPAVFVIWRSGPTNDALPVGFEVKGTSANGLDYSLITSPAIIPAGQRSTHVVIQPVDDNLAEDVESVVLILPAVPIAGTKASQPQGQRLLNDLAQQQDEVRKAAESLLSAQQAAPDSAMQSASESLQNAANAVGPLAAGALGQLPSGAQSSLQKAQSSAGEGSGQAAESQNTPAQMSAQQAAQALAQAQAALALAQAGLGSQMAGQQPGDQPGQGKGKGKGQGQGQGQGPGKGEGRNPGQPGPDGNGDGNWAGSGGGNGPRRNETGLGSFTRLPSRDRAALLQSQAEKYPQEFGPLVEQYLRNLSDQGSQK